MANRKLVRRLVNLYLGLGLFGLCIGMIVQSGLGLGPWDVFHQGLSKQLGIPLGTIVIGVGVLVLLLWIPLRQRIGLGTISNTILIGLGLDATIAVLDQPRSVVWQWLFLIGGIVGCGFATGLYIGARFGPGPRDGLMTGLAARGYSIRVVRTAVEVAVLVVGWLMGGTVGIGTILFAFAIGPLAHIFIPLLRVGEGSMDDSQVEALTPPSAL